MALFAFLRLLARFSWRYDLEKLFLEIGYAGNFVKKYIEPHFRPRTGPLRVAERIIASTIESIDEVCL